MFNSNVLNEFKQLVGEAKVMFPTLNMIEDESEYSLLSVQQTFIGVNTGGLMKSEKHITLKKAKKRLMEKTEELICRLPSRPEQIILATGSDWFHVDTDAGTTTKVHHKICAEVLLKSLMTGCKLAREHIDLLRQVAPVKVVFMPGNHDRMSAIALMMYLSAVYEETKDCEVVVSPSTRQYVHYGNNLLGFIHGDGAKNLVELMSNEERALWGECEHHAWFHGHLHHRQVVEKGGCLIVQLPSLAGHDRYHARQGYTTSKAGLAHIY
jgi:Icc-related predicted phosphoesterase